MPKETEDVQAMEKETIVFHGTGGTVTWTEFEKSIARYFRLKYGSEIGEMLWRNELPIIDGDEAIDRYEWYLSIVSWYLKRFQSRNLSDMPH